MGIRGIEQGSNKVFLACMPNQTIEILEEIIVKYMELGTTITSDCWRAYGMERVQQLGYFHQTVNCTYYLCDLDKGHILRLFKEHY